MLPRFYKPHPFSKGLLCLIGAALMTVAMFAVMQYLISSPPVRGIDLPGYSLIEIQKPREDTEAGTIKRAPPPPPPTPSSPPRQWSENVVRPVPPVPAVSTELLPAPALENLPGTEIQWQGLPDGSATPLERANPVYPEDAKKQRIGGWVKLSFTISPNGKVTNVRVVDANPANIFNQAALDAVRSWKYRPKVVDGRPVAVEGQTVMLEFNVMSKK